MGGDLLHIITRWHAAAGPPDKAASWSVAQPSLNLKCLGRGLLPKRCATAVATTPAKVAQNVNGAFHSPSVDRDSSLMQQKTRMPRTTMMPRRRWVPVFSAGLREPQFFASSAFSGVVGERGGV